LMHVKNLRCFNKPLIIQLENFFLKTVYAGFRFNTSIKSEEPACIRRDGGDNAVFS